MKLILSFIILLSFLIYVSPFYSLYKIGTSIQNQDERSLNSYMDWPMLQESLRRDVKTFLREREKMREKNLDNPIEGIFEDVKQFGGLLFGEKAIDIAINKVVTPNGIFKLYKLSESKKTKNIKSSEANEISEKTNNDSFIQYQGYALTHFSFASLGNIEANVSGSNVDVFFKMKFNFPRWILYTVKSDKLTNEIAKKVEDKIDLLKNLNRKINPLKKK